MIEIAGFEVGTMDEVMSIVEEDTSVEELLLGAEGAVPIFVQASDILVVVALASERAASDHCISTQGQQILPLGKVTISPAT